MRPALVAILSALLLAAPGGTAHAATVHPKGAGFTLELPSGWKSTQPQRGWRFKAIAPEFSAWVFVSARDDTVDRASYEASFVAFEREQADQLGPHTVFRTYGATVGTEHAVLVYTADPGATAEYSYGFVHRGVDYVLAFATTPDRVRAERPVFTRVLRSVRFLNT